VGEVQVETGHAWVHGGARLIAMGGGEHGARGWLVRTLQGARQCVQGDRERGVPSSWRPCTCPTWPRRGHGGATVLGTAASDGVGTKMGQGPGLAFRVTVHACWGAHLRESVAARTDAHATRAHRHGAAATKQGGVLRLEG
jgi:hypothetical protein